MDACLEYLYNGGRRRKGGRKSRVFWSFEGCDKIGYTAESWTVPQNSRSSWFIGWLEMGLRFVIGCFCIGGIFGIFRVFQALSKKKIISIDCIFSSLMGQRFLRVTLIANSCKINFIDWRNYFQNLLCHNDFISEKNNSFVEINI